VPTHGRRRPVRIGIACSRVVTYGNKRSLKSHHAPPDPMHMMHFMGLHSPASKLPAPDYLTRRTPTSSQLARYYTPKLGGNSSCWSQTHFQSQPGHQRPVVSNRESLFGDSQCSHCSESVGIDVCIRILQKSRRACIATMPWFATNQPSNNHNNLLPLLPLRLPHTSITVSTMSLCERNR
jgi:hypothetical protein